MYCIHCGEKINDTDLFCQYCGNSTELSGDIVTTGSANLELASITEPFQISDTNKNPSSRLAKIYIVVALLIISVGVGLLVLNRAQKADSPNNTFQSSIVTQEEQNNNSTIANTGNSITRLTMQFSQIDNSAFPNITIYTRIQDENGVELTSVDKQLFTIKEFSTDGKEYLAKITDILPLGQSDAMNINLVLDRSGSMMDENKMQSAKNAAYQFVDEILKSNKNSVELTVFDTYAYNMQPFTSDVNLLHNAINSIFPADQTALYDALYDALISTNQRSGSRFIIAFTDGIENASLHTQDEVIELSKMTGIPVYLIGIGSDTDYATISNLAYACNGEYFNASVVDLQEILIQIYDEIYSMQRNLYKVCYTSTYSDKLMNYRTVKIETADDLFEGSAELEYMPVDLVAHIDNAKLISLITKYNTTDNVAVALVDLNTSLEYRVGSVRNTFVASGFYAPVYIVTHGGNLDKANQMMEQMDNSAGNKLIDEIGGFQKINNALAGEGFTQTTFSRYFGDTAASDKGYENYTSALDSAKILRELYEDGGYTKMKWDLTKDGISVPSGATIYSHRGQGIGGAYNVFAIIISGDIKYGLAIMTMHPGKTNEQAKAIAVPMITEIINEMHTKMVGSQ